MHSAAILVPRYWFNEHESKTDKENGKLFSMMYDVREGRFSRRNEIFPSRRCTEDLTGYMKD